MRVAGFLLGQGARLGLAGMAALGGPLFAADAPGLAKAPLLAQNQLDAATVFARQAVTAVKPTGTTPLIIGSYLWGGRADQDYRPFFQWEFRLASGVVAIEHPRARLSTLGPARQVLVAGAWKEWPSLGVAATGDVSYRMNCPTFAAYQLELAWAGGSETYVGCDKAGVPVALSAIHDQGYVVAVNVSVEEASDKNATSGLPVTWTDWNLGGMPAREVVHTLHLRDQAGKELKAIPYHLKVAALAAASMTEQRFILIHQPAFASLSISTEQAEDTTAEVPGFTDAKDVEVAEVHAVGTRLLAKVRNGLATAIDGVSVTITLEDKQGVALGTRELPVPHLESGAITEVSAELGTIRPWVGYETAWHSTTPIAPPAGAPAAPSSSAPASDTPATAVAPASPSAAPSVAAAGAVTAHDHLPGTVTADGLSFAPRACERSDAGWLLRGTLTNGTPTNLPGISLQLGVDDSHHHHQEVVWRGPALAAGADHEVVVACTLEDIAELHLRWRSVAH